jgi:hypothetical protein
MKISALISLVCFLMLSSNSFASFKVCGEISQTVGALIFSENSPGSPPLESSIYGTTSAVTQSLSELVGSGSVCVEATSDEGDIVVSRILSQ